MNINIYNKYNKMYIISYILFYLIYKYIIFYNN